MLIAYYVRKYYQSVKVGETGLTIWISFIAWLEDYVITPAIKELNFRHSGEYPAGYRCRCLHLRKQHPLRRLDAGSSPALQSLRCLHADVIIVIRVTDLYGYSKLIV